MKKFRILATLILALTFPLHSCIIKKQEPRKEELPSETDAKAEDDEAPGLGGIAVDTVGKENNSGELMLKHKIDLAPSLDTMAVN